MIHLHKKVKRQLSIVTRCGLIDNPRFWRLWESRNRGNREILFYEKDPVTEESIYFNSEKSFYNQIIQLNPIGGL